MKKILRLLSFVLSISTYMASAQVYTINTFAGTGSPGYGSYSGDGGPATAAELCAPQDVAIDSAGNVYIADLTNARIRMVNTSGIISTVIGTGVRGYSGDGGPASSAEIGNIFSMTIDDKGNIYLGDEMYYCVRKINTSGIITTVAGNGTGGFSGDGGPATAAELKYPAGIAVDAAGNMYIGDYYNNRVRKVNTSGIISTVAGNGTPGFSGDGGAATVARLSAPNYVVLDGLGNYYIADMGNYCIRKVNTSGIISTFAGMGQKGGFAGDGGPATAARLWNPTGIKLDAEGNMYISDYSNSRIRKVSLSGTISTIAGNGTQGLSGDGGPALNAEFYQNNNVAVNMTNGNIYVADTYNNRIRVLTTVEGINQLANAEVETTVYPNPNKGIFTIGLKSQGSKTKETIYIYAISGQKIVTIPSTESDRIMVNLQTILGKNNAGIYFYLVRNSEGKVCSSGKFIIE